MKTSINKLVCSLKKGLRGSVKLLFPKISNQSHPVCSTSQGGKTHVMLNIDIFN